MHVKQTAVSTVAAFVLLAGCGQPNVSTQGTGNGTKPGDQGPGYTLPPATGSPGGGGGTNPGGGTTPTTDMNCGIQMFDLHSGPADLLLVLDRSGSMLQDVNGIGAGGGRRGMMMGPAKWDQVV